MSLAPESLGFITASPAKTLQVSLATSADDIAASQRLRHQVFVE